MKTHNLILLFAFLVLLALVGAVETFRTVNPTGLASVLGSPSLMFSEELRPWITFQHRAVGDGVYWGSRPAGEALYPHAKD